MRVDEKLIRFIETDLARGKTARPLCVTDNLIDTAVIDSLGIMKLIQFLEETYGVLVSDDDLVPENFSSIASIHQLIEGKRKAA